MARVDSVQAALHLVLTLQCVRRVPPGLSPMAPGVQDVHRQHSLWTMSTVSQQVTGRCQRMIRVVRSRAHCVGPASTVRAGNVRLATPGTTRGLHAHHAHDTMSSHQMERAALSARQDRSRRISPQPLHVCRVTWRGRRRWMLQRMNPRIGRHAPRPWYNVGLAGSQMRSRHSA